MEEKHMTTTSRGKPCLLLNGFSYTIKKQGLTQTTWICRFSTCKTTLTQRSDIYTVSSPHNHNASYDANKKLFIRIK